MFIQLHGKWRYRLQSLLNFYWSLLYVSIRRLWRGPLLPNWRWNFEVSTHFIKMQTRTAFNMPDYVAGREYENSLIVPSPALAQLEIEPIDAPIKGHWYRPPTPAQDRTLLYLHGGGYAYYSKWHDNLIALITVAAQAQTFALDYRLIPEHPFPAQLEDALAAYRWLLETGIKPEHLAVGGDSAGGNLTLALLLALREAQLPLPALGICLSPWTDVGNSGKSLIDNEPFDWVEKRMPMKWAEWLCRDADPRQPLVSPLHADLQGLPPIYMQAGDAEILYDMIQAFYNTAQAQGANIKLDVWSHMNHDFQAFGDLIPESRAALQQIGKIIQENVR